MKSSSDFANRLKQERKKLGLTQAQVAEKCGISGRMWGDYERGVSQPKAELLFQFEKAGIDVNYVMTGKTVAPIAASQPESGLSDDERELLTLFRAASQLGQAVILSEARGAEKKAVEIENRQVA